MRVLLVEDERALSSAIVKRLRARHIETEPVFTGTDGFEYARAGEYDAIILDVMLPGMDGFAVLEALRKEKIATPVLMLTARGEVEDRVQGLTLGADYYLPKPFDFEELFACLKAITRRGGEALRTSLSFGDLVLRESDGHLACAATGKSVKLGAKEYQLMELLLRNPNQILPKELMLERVWGLDSEAEYNALEVYVSFLRRKLSFVGSAVRIRATRGVGYALEAEA